MASTIISSTSYYPLGTPQNNRMFKAAGRIFVVFSDGTNLVFRSSTDGTTWSSSTTITSVSGSVGRNIVWYFDGTRVHYARARDDPYIYYRSGIPQSDGSITWDGAEVTAVYNASSIFRVMNIRTDSSGKPLICYRESSNLKHVYVTKNNNSNTTWSAASGYPKQITSSQSTIHFAQVIPLTSDKWSCFYCSATGGHIYERVWNGSSLGSAVQATDVVCTDVFNWNACGRTGTDERYLGWCSGTSSYTQRVRKNLSGSWTGEYNVASTGINKEVPILVTNVSTGDIFAFWENSNKNYYRQYTVSSSTWQTAVDLGTDGILKVPNYINISDRIYGNEILYLYTRNSGIPYDVRYQAVASVESSTSYINTSDEINISESVRVIKSGTDYGPFSVGSTTHQEALGKSFTSKAFVANGRMWLFFFSGNSVGHVSSVDGTNWTAFTGKFPVDDPDKVCVVCDGQRFHAVMTSPDNRLHYYRGVANANGTVTWTNGASCNEGGQVKKTCGICLDTLNRPVLIFKRDNEIWVAYNVNKDGAWQNYPGFPVKLSSTATEINVGSVVPLKDGKWYAVWCGASRSEIRGKLWNGTSMGAEEQASDIVCSEPDRFSIASFNDEVRLSWNAYDGTPKIYSRRRTAAGWEPGQMLAQTEEYYTAKYYITKSGSTYYAKTAQGTTVSSSTNAYTVIQYALNNLTSGRTSKEKVLIQTSCTIPTNLEMPSYAILECAPGVVMTASGDNRIIVSGLTTPTHDWDIIGGEWVCVSALASMSVAPMHFFDATNCTVQNCKVRDCMYYNIIFNNAKYCTVRNVESCNDWPLDPLDCPASGWTCLMFQTTTSTTNNLVEACYFHDKGHGGVYFYSNEDGLEGLLNDNIVRFCTVKNCGTSGISISQRSSIGNGHRNLIENNYLVDCGQDGDHPFINVGWSDCYPSTTTYNIVRYNTLIDNGNTTPDSPSQYGADQGIINQASYTEIYNNNIKGARNSIAVLCGTGVHIHHNCIHDNATTYGIYLLGTAVINANVHDNSFFNMGTNIRNDGSGTILNNNNTVTSCPSGTGVNWDYSSGIYVIPTAVAQSSVPGTHMNFYDKSSTVFWKNGNSIVYRKHDYETNTWGDLVEYYTETEDIVSTFINVSPTPQNNLCFVSYIMGSDTPYSARLLLLPSEVKLEQFINRLKIINPLDSGAFIL